MIVWYLAMVVTMSDGNEHAWAEVFATQQQCEAARDRVIEQHRPAGDLLLARCIPDEAH